MMLTCPDCGIPNPDDWHTCVQYENNQKVEKQIKLLQMQVENLHERMTGVEQMIQDKINTMATNIANEVAEKVMIQIANKLSFSDV